MMKNLFSQKQQAKKKPMRKKKSGFWNRLVASADRLAFNWGVRESLYLHLATQVANKVGVEDALDKFRVRLRRGKKTSSDKIIGDVARRMRDGVSLATALAEWVPQDEMGIIASGELSGNLPRALDLVVEAKERVRRVVQAMVMALTTPVVQSVIAFALIWWIARYITPTLQMVLPENKATGSTLILYQAGHLANSWVSFFLPIAIVGFIWVVYRSLDRWTGPWRIKAENYFPYSFYRDIQGYAWIMSFTALLRAGIPDVEILKRQMLTATPWMKERLAALCYRMESEGLSLAAALLSKGKKGMPPFGFPNPDVVDDIGSISGFKDFPEKMNALAIKWADRLERSILVKAKVIGFWMEMLMYSVLIYLVVAINSMSEQLGSTNMYGVN